MRSRWKQILEFSFLSFPCPFYDYIYLLEFHDRQTTSCASRRACPCVTLIGKRKKPKG